MKGNSVTGNSNLLQMVTRERLIEFLRIHGESDEHDFKETVDLKGKEARAECARDVLAFMNTDGGGHIVFGVQDKSFEPVGLDPKIELDTTKLHNALTAYIDGKLSLVAAVYEINGTEIDTTNWTGSRRFGIVYIARRPGIARPKVDAAFPDTSGKMVQVLQVSNIFVRRGAQSVLANTADLERLFHGVDAISDDRDDNIPTPLVTSLPSAEEVTTHFVGRRAELEQLREWLDDPQSRLRLLAGDGGKGKSAIAYQFATRTVAKPPTGLEGALWVSAKRRRFVEGLTQPISRPDFQNLDTLLDALARGYGFDEYVDLPLQEKRSAILELLTDLPVLLIADDIDSLEGSGDDAFMFLISDVMQTRSKILLTSRDVKFGLNTVTIQVAGLIDTDAEGFIRSRVHLFALDATVFTSRVIREIMQVTDTSPLYMEDLLRLCMVLPVADALARWRERSGDAAREYALKREFDRLPDSARRIVIAACLNDSPISYTELQAVTGLSDQDMETGINALQKLFLVSKPQLIEGVERYDVNLNTRTLVLETQRKEHPELMRQLTEAHRQVTGRVDRQSGRELGSYIRQATALQSLGRDDEAEATILAALSTHPNHASLIAQLGIIASRRRPPNRTDARMHFVRAAQLKCRREQMYLLWAHLEESDHEWQAALNAIAQGRAHVGDTTQLLHEAGYAHSRWGQQLLRELHIERGTKELIEAHKCYRQALKKPEELMDEEELRLNGRILRGLALAFEALCRVDRKYIQSAKYWAQRYLSEHPGDERARELFDRIAVKYPDNGKAG